ncbi:hypothetical protein KSP40_PGU019599 [Platanthera guangdongensis]|uniref:Uncharacterized protein n=1 Tax=Platanthera guangdongensis TaxID=2320717 RepID=A0ABR2M6M1_9ASPA
MEERAQYCDWTGRRTAVSTALSRRDEASGGPGTSQQHTVCREPSARMHPDDAANALLPVPGIQGGSDDRDEAGDCFCRVRGRDAIHGVDAGSPGFQDDRSEPDDHLIREEVETHEGLRFSLSCGRVRISFGFLLI